ncbi:hypothetical protein J6590_019765 [Homalodisca vitripennis]|nr:hypothetical protein J6590_019765 [Homalodisca vitripennis]
MWDWTSERRAELSLVPPRYIRLMRLATMNGNTKVTWIGYHGDSMRHNKGGGVTVLYYAFVCHLDSILKYSLCYAFLSPRQHT